MTATRINPAPQFTFQQWTKSVAKNGGSAAVAASALDGYQFVCWLQPATSGWVGACYMENPSAASTNVWSAYVNQTGTGNVICRALYVKA
jgi:hypothetical protein